MKLIKLSEEHYIIVDDSEIKEGDWVVTKENTVHQVDYVDAYTKINDWKKITHSTFSSVIDLYKPNTPLILNLSEVKELLGEVDVEQYAWDNPVLSRKDVYELFNDVFKDKRIEGSYQISASKEVYQFNRRLRELAKQKSLEDNKERKYTEEDMVEFAMCMIAQYVQGNTNIWDKGMLFESLPQPKTEWEVEFNDGKLKLI